MLKSLALLFVVALGAQASEENGATFDAAIAGKAAFVKFLAPW
jgi:hypothetical protein